MARVCLPGDHDGAVREVAQVYELIKTHQPLLLHHHEGQQDSPPTTQFLLSEALRALNIALSAMTVMQQQQQQGSSSTTASPQLSSPSPASESATNSNGATTGTSARSGKRRRPALEGGENSSSWVNITNVPYEDGYEWRKYGEKKINGTHFTRSYFRCTYKNDTGCPALKYVQQKDSSDPPMFHVTYKNEHTCNCTRTPLPAKKNNNLPTGGASSSNNDPPIGGHHDVMVVKQQATTALLPPPSDVSTVPLDDQMPCQEPFPIADQYVTIGGGHSPCIPGMSCDELDFGPIMTEPLIEMDPELQIMYDSFKVLLDI